MLRLNIRQKEELFKVGKQKFAISKEQLQRGHILDFSFKELEEEDITPFLDFHFEDNRYKRIFLLIIDQYLARASSSGVPGPAIKIAHEWLDSKISLNRNLTRSAHNLFVEDRRYHKEQKLDEWEKLVEKVLGRQTPSERLSFLEYGRQLMEEGLKIHNIICEAPNACQQNLSFQKRISVCKSFLRKLKGHPDKSEKDRNPEFTLSRQMMAIYYLLEYSKVHWTAINYTDIARFIQFLTGREAMTTKIGNTRIYQEWGNFFHKSEKRNRQDLIYIRQYFQSLGLTEIVKMITNDIENIES